MTTEEILWNANFEEEPEEDDYYREELESETYYNQKYEHQ